MSAVSPHYAQNDSTDRNLDSELSNLYLSTAVDPEEAEFQSSGIRLTPVDDRGSAWNGSASPLEQRVNNVSTPGNEGHGTSYVDYLSPTDAAEDWNSDMSGHTSPAEYMMPGPWQANSALAEHIQPSSQNQFDPSPPSPHMIVNPAQLLTPNLTNNPSPSSDTMSVHSNRQPRSHHPPVPRLITTPQNDNLDPRPAAESVTAVSPIVKVESYSRGDSPIRDSFSTNRRPSQSSAHLSPGGMSNTSEDDTFDSRFHPVPRSEDGKWVPNERTGQSGLSPDARKEEYGPSPNEMASQRQLEQKNADIYSWSAAVSEAHSDAGDEYLRSPRIHENRRGNRPRARSTGDPSFNQQDYFNLKVYTNQPEVPGPGLLLHEPSEYSEDTTASSAPVSVNERRWAQDASDITPPEPHNNETTEPQPQQFLGSPPWKDIVPSSTPQTTQTQPASSTQAIIQFTRRAQEFDRLSRVATWGTRPFDAESIRSSQRMSVYGVGKEKKHERRPSLLKYLPQKGGNLLKRGRRSTDLSSISPVPEGDSQISGSKPSPQRKDSFPHRLGLNLGPKSPDYSIGGALMATTRQMSAIGGKDSLSVVSPSTSSKPWNTLKSRARSRSELPRAPGLFELMTSHGGPPVPNINYSAEPREAEEAQRAPEHDAAEEEDDEDGDEKGLVMDFPIPPNLPIPTLEGFRTQILQLNPRLEPALVDRFAHEQVRRYKRLIEVKQAHTRDVDRRKCKAGMACFALGGKAKLLPPRASAQDADSHTQFQIPGRGEMDESPDALGETTIAAAQFPPGVPLPPQQVTLLPAEFECMVCFHVKKFQKPSDWTKHIYEDVQPFTCTFPDCTDPKSFKRKADWVRHESERHRQLEWWECSFTDCRHKCYRKDNFVQHLVREHKLPEPKVKKPKSKGQGSGSKTHITPEMQEEITREQDVKRLWALVEECRYDTTKNPKDEPCRFCGNVCANWKKLTVHLAKHMEQLAIPILGLVDEREFPYSTGSTGQLPVAQEVNNFAPRLNTGVTEGLGPAINFTPAQVQSDQAGAESLAVPFGTNTSYLPATSMPMNSTAQDQMNGYEGVSYGSYNGGMSGGMLAPTHDPTQLMAMNQHQDSVTYPPPFNAGPRTRVPDQTLGILPDYNNNFSMSPTEMQYDPQGTMYVPNGAENHYTYHGPMASAMYTNSGYQGQGQ
ncbi:hypothetical protein BDV18DRAFT_145770 [Aspergillus unguis]